MAVLKVSWCGSSSPARVDLAPKLLELLQRLAFGGGGGEVRTQTRSITVYTFHV
jgi:hypothetical protein